MHELGNVLDAAQSTRALKPPGNKLTDPAQETEITKIIVDDDAAAVFTGKLWHLGELQPDNRNADVLLSTSWPTNTDSQSQVIQSTSESSRGLVFSDPSKLRVKLADEIKAINSFDGFMLGVHDKIEKFSEHTEFGLEQVLDVEQRMGELYETLELYRFTLKRIQSEALKTLRCQGNLGPQRVLCLLKDSSSEQVTEQAVAAPEQNSE